MALPGGYIKQYLNYRHKHADMTVLLPTLPYCHNDVILNM